MGQSATRRAVQLELLPDEQGGAVATGRHLDFVPLRIDAPDVPALPHGVLRLAPKATHVFLKYSVPSFFRRNRELAKACQRLYRGGVERVGDLIRLSPVQLLAWLDGDAQKLALMRARLAAAGLDLQMTAPGWEDLPRQRLALRGERRLSRIYGEKARRALIHRAAQPPRAELIRFPYYQPQLPL